MDEDTSLLLKIVLGIFGLLVLLLGTLFCIATGVFK